MDTKNSQFVKDNTSQLADELARHADKPVTVNLRAGEHLQSKFGSDSNQAVAITMDTTILMRIHKEDVARDIWRGYGYYLLQAQLAPCKKQFEDATAQGFLALFGLLNDEQNERQATTKNPDLGTLFQKLAAHVYVSSKQRRADGLNGLAMHKTTGLEACGTYIQRFNEFAYYLRRRLRLQKPDAQVAQALKAVPENLRDLSKGDLVALARKLHDILAKDVVLAATAAVREEPKVQKVVKADPKAPPPPEPEPEDPLVTMTPVDPKWWQLLLKNPWSYVTAAGSLFVWLILCFSVGLEFWRAAFWTLGAASTVVMAVVGIRYYLHKRAQRPRQPDYDNSGPGFDWEAFFQGMSKWFSERSVEFWLAVVGVPVVTIAFWLCGYNLFVALLCAAGILAIGTFLVRTVRITVRGTITNADGTTTEVGFSDAVGACFAGILAWFAARWRGFKRLLANGRDVACECGHAFWHSKIVTHLRTSASNGCSNFCNWCAVTATLLWRSPSFRIFLTMAPIAMAIVMTAAITMFAAELALGYIILILVVWLALSVLGYWFFDAIRMFLTADVQTDEEVEHDVACRFDQDKLTKTFTPITTVISCDADPKFLLEHADAVAAAAPTLRESLRKMGFVTVDKDGATSGVDVIEELELSALGETDLLVDEQVANGRSLAMDILIDCSNSKSEPTTRLRKGDKFVRSKQLALVIEEAVKRRHGISVRTWGYTDKEFLSCGNAGQGRVSGLPCAGGNNDAAALFHGAQSVKQRKASIRAVVMITDTQPADSTWGALNNLGWQLMQDGVHVILVVVDEIDDPALPWHVVDFHTNDLKTATQDLGRALESLVTH